MTTQTPATTTPNSPAEATASTPAPQPEAAPAATPAPAPTAPAAAPTSEPAEPADEGLKSFLADEAGDDEGAEAEEAPTEEPPKPASTPNAVEAAPEADPSKPTPPAPTPEAPPPPAAAQPAQPTPEPQPELSPEQVHERFRQYREEAITLLTEKHYNLSADQVKEIVDPETGMVNGEKLAKTVSRVASQVYMDVVTAAMGQMVQNLPALIHRYNEARQTSQNHEAKFFEAWPDLKDHRDVVIRIGTAFRQANPKASLEQFVQEVGASAMIALRKTPTARPIVPAATPAPQPFRPAAASRPATPPPTNAPLNPFAQLAMMDQQDETSEEVE